MSRYFEREAERMKETVKRISLKESSGEDRSSKMYEEMKGQQLYSVHVLFKYHEGQLSDSYATPVVRRMPIRDSVENDLKN